MNYRVATHESIVEIKNEWQRRFKSVVRLPSIELERDLFITPFPGHYGLAGYVITIQGSPIHGFAVIELGEMNERKIVCNCFHDTRSVYRAHTVYGPADKRKNDFIQATLDLLIALDLPTEPGRDLPGICCIRAAQKQPEEQKGGQHV